MAGYIGSKSSVTQVDGYNRTEADDRYVNASGDTMTGDLVVNANVGIGTSSPSSKLDIVGTSDTYARINDGAVNLVLQSYTTGSSAIIGTTSNHALTLWSNAAERMRIDSSGNPMWGTTSVTNNDGGISAQIRGSALGTTSFFQFRRGTATNTAGTVLAFFHGGTLVGSVSHTNTSTTYATSSDYRLKEDVQPMVGASDRVLALKPCNFAWKDGGARTDGFIAHEAQAVVPEAVHGTKDEVDADGNPVYQGIDQSKLVPLLTAALQEALWRIETLEADVAALKGATNV